MKLTRAKLKEIIREELNKLRETADLEKNDIAAYKTHDKFMQKAFKKAGIRVLKMQPMKMGFTRATFGVFYTVKAGKTKTVIPVYIDKKGYINLGISAGGWEIGRLDGFSKVVRNLKDFKESDFDIQ